MENLSEQNQTQIIKDSFFKKIFNFLFKRNLKLVILLAVVMAAIFFYINKQDQKNILVGKLETGNLEEVVTVSGDIEASEESSLAFEKAGKIIKINVKVGDKVTTGEKLASLNDASDAASVLSARASVDQAEANLLDIANGPSQSDLNVKKDLLNSARNNLVVADSSFHDLIFNVNQSLTDILKNKLANLFNNNSGVYTLTHNYCDQSLAFNIETERSSLEKDLINISSELNNFSLLSDNEIDSSTVQSIDIEKQNNQIIDKTLSVLSISTKNVSKFLDDLNALFTSSCSISDSGLDNERSIVSNTRLSISSTMSSISSVRSQILGYRSSYSSALSSLNQLLAGASSEKIKSMSALLNSARANLSQAIANENKNFIIAPFDGIVTKVDINLGEISSPNTGAISLISDNNSEMKIKLAEIDAVKVKVLDKAKISLDTYGDSVVFNGSVSQIDPAATVEGGVSNYYGKISFDKTNTDLDKIKIGMNGTADIVVNQKENVNYIDARFIKIIGNEAFVKVIKDINKLEDTTTSDSDSNIEIRNVVIGIRGDNGKIEIISGITKEDNLFPVGAEILSNTSSSSSVMNNEINAHKAKDAALISK